MDVDPAVRALLAQLGEEHAFDVEGARAALAEYDQLLVRPDGPEAGEDDELAGVPVRRYPATGDGPHLVWLHGGGFVVGSLDATDPLCRAAAARTGGAVTSVAYRLAPEHPFPAALEDALAVVRAVGERVVVVGESAGGALAAAVARELPDLVVAQVLLCPWLDLTLQSPSVRELGRGYGLTERGLRSFAELYLDGADASHPRCSPLLAEDVSGLPPAVVVTAGLDPLRDDGVRWAERLRAAGVPVELRDHPSMVHGFVGLASITPVADEAMDWAVGRLRALTA